MLNSTPQANGVVFNSAELEIALRVSGWGKKSKQRFLKASCTDTTIRRSRKGTGGNTVVYHCIIVKQAAVAEETIEELRKGVHLINLIFSVAIIMRFKFHSTII